MYSLGGPTFKKIKNKKKKKKNDKNNNSMIFKFDDFHSMLQKDL